MADEPVQRAGGPAAAARRRDGAGAPTLAAQVDASARRKLRAQRIGAPVVWLGLGVMGVVGWSVVVPTLLGAMLGIWLDDHPPAGARSWTLALMMAGLVLGCFNAWFWVAQQERAMRDEQTGDEQARGDD